MQKEAAASATNVNRSISDHCGFLWRFVVFALPFWSGEHKWINRFRLAAMATLTIAQVAVQAGLNFWSARLYNALERRELDTFLAQIVTFAFLLLADLAVFAVSLYVKRRLQFAWRVWLTRTTLSVWMAEGRHYLLGLIAGDHDNPDGRIAEDIRVTTESAMDLGQSLLYCILLLITFVGVLWSLSGVVHLQIGKTILPIHGYMVWIALIYSTIGTSMAVWVGLPLVGASNLRQTVEANFRFGLARAREYSESIALIGGDGDERLHLLDLLRGVRTGWERQTYGLTRIILFTTAYSVLASPFPLLVAAPRYIMRLISLGTLMQTAQAFQQVTAALSFPVDNLSGIAQWRASVERVMALQEALNGLEEKLGENRIAVRHDGTSLQFAAMRVTSHEGVPMMRAITADIGPGEHVMIDGDQQICRKLMLAVTGLWPWGDGQVTLPAGARISVATDRPYLPVGALGAAVCYPLELGVCVPDDIKSALHRVGLGEWADRLAVVDNWEQALSVAQQQRLSFARLLLHRPNWIFLAEATNALDRASQREIAALLTAEFPAATILATGQDGLFEGFFQRVLRIEADGAAG
jgi:vitamin B12/bleomycin/antimicrobial peptide transport system ATP-binding/permease protein